MQVWKQWTDEHRKTGSGRWKVTSVCDDQPLLHLAVNDHTASSSQFAARWSTATGVQMLASSIRRCLLYRGLRSRVSLHMIPHTANHSWLRLQWAHEHRACKLIGTKLSFQMNPASICGTMINAFMVDAMPVNAAFQSALSNNIVA
ncbi:transposable element Tcb2 transposase [Trichonephila clavipes]|nr:transposable element Tcb2 transposase [Trichonephila clavipes]